MTTTLGIGVLFSAIPVILYEGLITIFATQIERVIPRALMNHFIIEMTATGGIMIIAIGLNLTGITKFKVANLLPGIVVTLLIVSIMYRLNHPFESLYIMQRPQQTETNFCLSFISIS